MLHALLAGGAATNDDLIARGLLFLDHEQDRRSLWYSTQATARALDVLADIALRDKVPANHAAPGALTVSIDGRAPISKPLPPSNQDAGPMFIPLGSTLAAGEHHLTLAMPANSGAATAQMVASFLSPLAHNRGHFRHHQQRTAQARRQIQLNHSCTR